MTEENFQEDFVFCVICGEKRKILGQHIRRKHNITKEKYKEMFPNCSLVSPSRKNYIKNAIIDKYGLNYRKGVPRTEQDKIKIKIAIRKTFQRGRTSWSKGKHWDDILGKERFVEINRRRKLALQKTLENKRKLGIKWKLPKGVRHKTAWGGYRNDLGFYVRSRWEANICRLLKCFNIAFQYEPRTFDLQTACYTPDLYLIDEKFYLEIKGRMDDKSKSKIDKFKERYPSIPFYILDRAKYILIEYLFKDRVFGWEYCKDMSYLNKVRSDTNLLRDYTLKTLTREDIVQLLKKC